MNIRNLNIKDIKKRFEDFDKVQAGLAELLLMVKDIKTGSVAYLNLYLDKTEKKIDDLLKLSGIKVKRKCFAKLVRPEIEKLLLEHSYLTSSEIYHLLLKKNVMENDRKNYGRVRAILSAMGKKGTIKKTNDHPCCWLWDEPF